MPVAVVEQAMFVSQVQQQPIELLLAQVAVAADVQDVILHLPVAMVDQVAETEVMEVTQLQVVALPVVVLEPLGLTEVQKESDAQDSQVLTDLLQ